MRPAGPISFRIEAELSLGAERCIQQLGGRRGMVSSSFTWETPEFLSLRCTSVPADAPSAVGRCSSAAVCCAVQGWAQGCAPRRWRCFAGPSCAGEPAWAWLHGQVTSWGRGRGLGVSPVDQGVSFLHVMSPPRPPPCPWVQANTPLSQRGAEWSS